MDEELLIDGWESDDEYYPCCNDENPLLVEEAETGSQFHKDMLDHMFMGWLASASREGYKIVPVDSLRIIMECVSCDDLNLYDGVMDAYDDIEKAMIGAIE